MSKITKALEEPSGLLLSGAQNSKRGQIRKRIKKAACLRIFQTIILSRKVHCPEENHELTHGRRRRFVLDTAFSSSNKTKNKQDPVGERLVSALERSVHSREQRERELESDCDRMFLLSLLNPLKQIPENARFGVKRKLMEVIEAEMKIYRPTLAPQMNPPQYQQNRSIISEQLIYTQPQNVSCSSNFMATIDSPST
jgi:hypothetical protein